MEPLPSCSATAGNSGILQFLGQKMEIRIICEPDRRWIVGGHGKNGDNVTCSEQEVEIDSVAQLEHKHPCLGTLICDGSHVLAYKKEKTSNVTLPSC
ncbi:UNVERIFIED_CONTAM: hypothetical protein Scaly_2369200 [Sesamum calycinum]|uniref:Uncharacterized protein n=1 Tax=Sesamum calycinum TaxID=2727403 RepID=A0AAW2M0R6_9LAMI